MELTIVVPGEVKVSKSGDIVAVSGPKGSVRKSFSHPRVSMDVSGPVRISTKSDFKKDRAVVGTWAVHMKNMFRGVQAGYDYKLNVVFTHFPLIIKAGTGEVTISNFMGEKGMRHAKVIGDTKVMIEKEYITVTGPDKENVAQTSANIEQACRKKKKDLRVFQDGVYIISKGNE